MTSTTGSGDVFAKCLHTYLPKRASLGFPQWESMLENEIPEFKPIHRGVAADTVGKAMLGWSSQEKERANISAGYFKRGSGSQSTGSHKVNIMKVHGDSIDTCSQVNSANDSTKTNVIDSCPPGNSANDSAKTNLPDMISSKISEPQKVCKLEPVITEEKESRERKPDVDQVACINEIPNVKSLQLEDLACNEGWSNDTLYRRRSTEELPACHVKEKLCKVPKSAHSSTKHFKQHLPCLANCKSDKNLRLTLATGKDGRQVCMHDLISHRYLADYRKRLDTIQVIT